MGHRAFHNFSSLDPVQVSKSPIFPAKLVSALEKAERSSFAEVTAESNNCGAETPTLHGPRLAHRGCTVNRQTCEQPQCLSDPARSLSISVHNRRRERILSKIDIQKAEK